MSAQQRQTIAIRASGDWNPYARRVINRILVLACSTRALESPRRMAASTPCLCCRIVRASLTNGLSLDRDAHASQRSSRSTASSGRASGVRRGSSDPAS